MSDHTELTPGLFKRSSEGRGAERDPTAGAAEGISRRQFVLATGVTIGGLSWLGTSSLARAATVLPPVKFQGETGFGDDFGQLALRDQQLALRAFDAIASANATTVRFPVFWDLVQPKPDALNWSSLEPLHRHLVWHGLRALPVVYGAPEWLPANEVKASANGTRYPVGSNALNAFGEFVVSVLKYFYSWGEHVDGVEIWSQPNNPDGAFIGEPAEFTRMVRTAAAFVYDENTYGFIGGDKRVVSGGLALTDASAPWQAYVNDSDIDAFPFAVGVHAYPDRALASIRR